jgi:hypothetical protein
MKWGDAALPAVLTLLTIVICAISFRHAFPEEAMTRTEKEQACWKMLAILATKVDSAEDRRTVMNSDYARKVCATIDLTGSPLTR